jgi:hypothetical protein
MLQPTDDSFAIQFNTRFDKVYSVNDRLKELNDINKYYTEIDYVLSDTLGLRPHATKLIPKTCQDTDASYDTKVALAVFEPYYQEVTGMLFTKICSSELTVNKQEVLSSYPALRNISLNGNLVPTIDNILFYSRYGYTLAIIEPSNESDHQIIFINPKNIMDFKPFNVKSPKDLTQLRYQVMVEDEFSSGEITTKVYREVRILDYVAINRVRFRKYRSEPNNYSVVEQPYYDETFDIENENNLGLPVFYFSLELYNIDRSILLRKPPFMEVVSLNLEYYLVKAGLNFVLFLSTYFKEYLFGVGTEDIISSKISTSISEVVGVTDPGGKSQWSQIAIKDLYDAHNDRLKEIKKAITFFAFSILTKDQTPSTVESAASKVADTEANVDVTEQHLTSLAHFFNELVNYYVMMNVANYKYTEFFSFKPKLPIVVNPQQFTQGNPKNEGQTNRETEGTGAGSGSNQQSS